MHSFFIRGNTKSQSHWQIWDLALLGQNNYEAFASRCSVTSCFLSNWLKAIPIPVPTRSDRSIPFQLMRMGEHHAHFNICIAGNSQKRSNRQISDYHKHGGKNRMYSVPNCMNSTFSREITSKTKRGNPTAVRINPDIASQ